MTWNFKKARKRLTNLKLSILSSKLKDAYPGIELGSVDGFQGREKEAVIVSLVRSNSEHEVGFLGEKRRLNGMLPSACRISHVSSKQTM